MADMLHISSSLSDLVSFIIVTSPSPSHPSINMLERIIDSIYRLNMSPNGVHSMQEGGNGSSSIGAVTTDGAIAAAFAPRTDETSENSLCDEISISTKETRYGDYEDHERDSLRSADSLRKIIIVFDGYIIQDKVQSKRGKVSQELAENYEIYYQRVMERYGKNDRCKILRSHEHIGFAMAVKLGESFQNLLSLDITSIMLYA
jgi:hypothetical protein